MKRIFSVQGYLIQKRQAHPKVVVDPGVGGAVGGAKEEEEDVLTLVCVYVCDVCVLKWVFVFQEY
jgi:hypothetical protein